MFTLKKSRKPSVITCYVLAYTYTLAAVLNDGFTGGFFALPFVSFLIWSSVKSYQRNCKKPVLVNSIFLLTAAFIYLSDRSDWSLVYPAVGQDIVVREDIKVGHSQFFPRHGGDTFSFTPMDIQSVPTTLGIDRLRLLGTEAVPVHDAGVVGL